MIATEECKVTLTTTLYHMEVTALPSLRIAANTILFAV